MKRIRMVLWALVALALVAFAALLLYPRGGEPPKAEPMAMASLGGPFTLVGSDGKPFASSRLAGKPFAIFFGFTHCPDVCPTTLARLAKLRRALGRGEQSFNIVFVSVDPERDGPTEVGTYAAMFGSPVIGLTGSPAQIAQVKKQFGIHSAKRPDGDPAHGGHGGYSVDHTATVLLFDRNGAFQATIAPEEQDEVALEKLRRLTA